MKILHEATHLSHHNIFSREILAKREEETVMIHELSTAAKCYKKQSILLHIYKFKATSLVWLVRCWDCIMTKVVIFGSACMGHASS